MKVKVRDLKPGDVTEWYTITDVFRPSGGSYLLKVSYDDGRVGFRQFDKTEGDYELELVRRD